MSPRTFHWAVVLWQYLDYVKAVLETAQGRPAEASILRYNSLNTKVYWILVIEQFYIHIILTLSDIILDIIATINIIYIT